MHYLAVIRKLCAQAEIGDWESIAKSQHLAVDGTTIGLIPKGDSDVTIYVDLGHQPGYEHQLLEHNACASDTVPGCFVIVPHSGKAAYRFDVPLALLEQTESLPNWLSARVNQARAALPTP